MLDEVIKRGRRRWRVKDRTVPPEPSSHAADVSGLLLVRYEARLRSLERQVADLKDEVRRLRGGERTQCVMMTRGEGAATLPPSRFHCGTSIPALVRGYMTTYARYTDELPRIRNTRV